MVDNPNIPNQDGAPRAASPNDPGMYQAPLPHEERARPNPNAPAMPIAPVVHRGVLQPDAVGVKSKDVTTVYLSTAVNLRLTPHDGLQGGLVPLRAGKNVVDTALISRPEWNFVRRLIVAPPPDAPAPMDAQRAESFDPTAMVNLTQSPAAKAYLEQQSRGRGDAVMSANDRAAAAAGLITSGATPGPTGMPGPTGGITGVGTVGMTGEPLEANTATEVGAVNEADAREAQAIKDANSGSTMGATGSGATGTTGATGSGATGTTGATGDKPGKNGKISPAVADKLAAATIKDK